MSATAAHAPLVQARGIVVSYGRQRVLDGIDVAVEPGEVVALLGPNGAGKTTLMSVLVGLRTADAGSVQAQGAGIGWVPQGAATYSRLTVRENLRLFAALLRLPGDVDAIARAAAEEAGLADWYDHAGWQLSGGLRQRLNVAVGLLGEPALLVLDEPTSGLDVRHRQALWNLLRGRAAAGCGIFFSAHTLEDAAVAQRVLVLAGGRLVFDGALAELGATPDAVMPRLVELWDGDAQ